MSLANLELAFYGELAEGADPAQAKQNVAAMFKASEEQVARMFSGNRVVIRNKLDFETAQKYVAAMKKRGALCKIEQMGQPGVEVSAPAAPAPAPAPVASAPEPANPAPATPASSASEAPASAPRADLSSSAPVQRTTTGTGLPVAGEKVDDILSDSHLTLGDVGERLEDEKPPIPELELSELQNVEILPPGTDLKDPEEEIAPVIPDVSHLSLKSD